MRRIVPYYEAMYPRQDGDSGFIWRSTIRAKACDDLRGLLPASTLSNVGIFATGQAYEGLLLRMRAHPSAEVRTYADLMLAELRKVIPSFLRRVDVPERGGRWSAYLADLRSRLDEAAATLAGATGATPEPRPEVTLVAWNPDAERDIAAAALYPHSDLPDDQLRSLVAGLGDDEVRRILLASAGDRSNRRHKPGRGWEAADYRFDILCDYGVFRDLQRHRLLTLDWQRLTPAHGFVTPESIEDIGAGEVWRTAMQRTADLYEAVTAETGADVAQYVVPFAYRIRFFFQLNAREAIHLLELRSAEGGHPDYRSVAQEMHRLIRDQAGHRHIADAMAFVDHADYDLGRLEGERRAAARRAAAGIVDPD
jgi:thymidylate synthase ThyX